MKKSLKEKGITLISLVVTIVILLILAGVTINVALSQNGLFSRTQNATEKYKKAQENEEDKIEKLSNAMEQNGMNYNDYVGAYVTGYTPDNGKCKIDANTSGMDTEQNFETEDMDWRIWDYDGRKIRLISANPTEATIKLRGQSGYNNGVWAVNEIARKCYGKNIDGIEALNLKRSDIQKVSVYDYTEYKHNSNNWVELTGDIGEQNDVIQFGETRKYTTNFSSPKMWSNHDYSWTYKYDKSTGYKSGDKMGTNPLEQEFNSSHETGKGETTASTEFKQSYYAHNYKDGKQDFKDERYYNLIFKKGDGMPTGEYWLACRYTALYVTHSDFGLSNVNGSTCYVHGYDFYHSDR